MTGLDNGKKDPVEAEVEAKKLPILPEVGSKKTPEEVRARNFKLKAELNKAVWEMDSEEEDDREKNPLKYVKRLLKGLGYKADEMEKVLADDENPYRNNLDVFVRMQFSRDLVPDADKSREKGCPIFVSREGTEYVDRSIVQALNYRSRVEKYLKRATEGFDYGFVCDVAAAKKSKALDDYTYALAIGEATTFSMKDQMLSELQKLLDEENADEEKYGDIDIAAIDEDRKISTGVDVIGEGRGSATDKLVEIMGLEETPSNDDVSPHRDSSENPDGTEGVDSESVDGVGGHVTEIDPEDHEESEEEAERRAEMERNVAKWDKIEADKHKYEQENMKPEMARREYLENLVEGVRQSGKQLTHEDYLAIGGEFDKAMYDFGMMHPEYMNLVVAVNDVVNVYLQMGYDGETKMACREYVMGTGIVEMFDGFDDQAYDLYDGSGDPSMITLLGYFEWLLDTKMSFLTEEFATDEYYNDGSDYSDENYGE